MSSVDVFVPCYGYGRFLRGAVDSILAQTGVDVRVLIIDDASPDETEAVARELAALDARVELRKHIFNRGHIATYNEGLEWARGDYVVLLSPDDLLTPGSFARAARLMDRHPEVTLVYGDDIPFHSMAAPAVDVSASDVCEWQIASYAEFVEASCALGATPIQAPAAVARLSAHKRVGGYLPDHPHSGDTEVWLRLASQGAVGRVDAVQAFRRIHTTNMSFKYSPLRRLQEHKRAFDTHFAGFGKGLPDVERLRARLYATLADRAFWTGSRAFDEGDQATCDECLRFASALSPAIRGSSRWWRLQWKRRLGASAWRWLEPMVSRARAQAAGPAR